MNRQDLDNSWGDSAMSTRRNSVEMMGVIASPPPTSGSDRRTLHEDTAPLRTNTMHSSTMHSTITRSNTVHSDIQSERYPDYDIEAEKKMAQETTRAKMSMRDRIHHFTWAWFTFPMSTGGLSLLIYAQPFKFNGLLTIGKLVYGINLAIFAIVCLTLLTRFAMHQGDLMNSIRHPREGFFVPTFFLATATVITSSSRYAIPEDTPAVIGAVSATFWIYLAVTLCLAIFQYGYIFSAHSFGLQTMMPSWILPIFPIMLTGTVATVILDMQIHLNPMPIIVAGLTCQGLGFWIAIMMYAHMIGRLMQSGLPNREHRPALFMCVGPPAFTALALIGMSNRLPGDFNESGKFPIHADTLRGMALLCAVFLWALSLWWFCIAAMSVFASPPEYFHLGCWAAVFPNTGFTLATISIGNAFQNNGILWFGTGMSIMVGIIYFVVLYFNIRAVIVSDIMYPGRDEDVEDH